jgi:hypothetical protein
MYMYGQSLSRRWKIGLKGNRFRIFEKIIFEFLHKRLANIYKNNKNFCRSTQIFQKWAILYFPWKMLHKETKIVTNIKTTGFFVQEFAGHEMSDFFITYTCANFVVKTPIFSKIFTETTFFYENRLFSRETEMFKFSRKWKTAISFQITYLSFIILIFLRGSMLPLFSSLYIQWWLSRAHTLVHKY